jgi:hypothetical protein
MKGWKSLMDARCVGGLTSGGGSLTTFQGGVNIK